MQGKGYTFEQANAHAELLRSGIQAMQIPLSGAGDSDYVTVSLGTATLLPNLTYGSADLIHAAEKALRKAKRSGRNRVVSI
ncbi:diguanylate cyclase domain-containing protein [Paenibacillus phyllosphaerae]